MSVAMKLPEKCMPYVDAAVISVAETQNAILIAKIEELCIPIIEHLYQNLAQSCDKCT